MAATAPGALLVRYDALKGRVELVRVPPDLSGSTVLWGTEDAKGYTQVVPLLVDEKWVLVSSRESDGLAAATHISETGRRGVWRGTFSPAPHLLMPIYLNHGTQPHLLVTSLRDPEHPAAGCAVLYAVTQGGASLVEVWRGPWYPDITSVTDVYDKDGNEYAFAYSEDTGEVHIDQVLGDAGFKTRFISQWTGRYKLSGFTMGGRSYMFEVDQGTGEVIIDRLNGDATGCVQTYRDSWKKGWVVIPFYLNDTVYLCDYSPVDGKMVIDRVLAGARSLEKTLTEDWPTGLQTVIALARPVPIHPSHISEPRVLQLLVGNSVGATHIAPVAKKAKGATGQDVTEWTVFVRTAPESQLRAEEALKQVVFKLHPTFVPKQVAISEPPFELTRSGWGTFTVQIIVHFHDALNMAPLTLEHPLSFTSNADNAVRHDVLVGARGVADEDEEAKEMNLLLQILDDLVAGRLVVSRNDACDLAALGFKAHSEFLKGAMDLLAPEYLRDKGIQAGVDASASRFSELTAHDARTQFVRHATGLPTYGFHIFSVQEFVSKTRKFSPVLLGFHSQLGIGRFNAETKVPFPGWPRPWAWLRRWATSRGDLRIDFGDHSNELYQAKTQQGQDIIDLISKQIVKKTTIMGSHGETIRTEGPLSASRPRSATPPGSSLSRVMSLNSLQNAQSPTAAAAPVDAEHVPLERRTGNVAVIWMDTKADRGPAQLTVAVHSMTSIKGATTFAVQTFADANEARGACRTSKTSGGLVIISDNVDFLESMTTVRPDAAACLYSGVARNLDVEGGLLRVKSTLKGWLHLISLNSVNASVTSAPRLSEGMTFRRAPERPEGATVVWVDEMATRNPPYLKNGIKAFKARGIEVHVVPGANEALTLVRAGNVGCVISQLSSKPLWAFGWQPEVEKANAVNETYCHFALFSLQITRTTPKFTDLRAVAAKRRMHLCLSADTIDAEIDELLHWMPAISGAPDVSRANVASDVSVKPALTKKGSHSSMSPKPRVQVPSPPMPMIEPIEPLHLPPPAPAQAASSKAQAPAQPPQPSPLPPVVPPPLVITTSTPAVSAAPAPAPAPAPAVPVEQVALKLLLYRGSADATPERVNITAGTPEQIASAIRCPPEQELLVFDTDFSEWVAFTDRAMQLPENKGKLLLRTRKASMVVAHDAPPPYAGPNASHPVTPPPLISPVVGGMMPATPIAATPMAATPLSSAGSADGPPQDISCITLAFPAETNSEGHEGDDGDLTQVTKALSWRPDGGEKGAGAQAGSMNTHTFIIDSKLSVIPWEQIELGTQQGAGGFGSVLEGSYLGTRVAIKVMNRVKLPSDVQEFVEEAAVLCELKHPMIVLFMGICVAENRYGIVTEFMEGGNLSQLLHTEHEMELSSDTRIRILMDVIKGMGFLHAKGIPHRDIKPANILLDGRIFPVKLCDFGLSGHKEAALEGSGTQRYAAPEVLLGAAADMRSDMYSFGIVLFEVITGLVPFKSGRTNSFATVGELEHAVLGPLLRDLTKTDAATRPGALACLPLLDSCLSTSRGLSQRSRSASQPVWTNIGNLLLSPTGEVARPPSGLLSPQSGSTVPVQQLPDVPEDSPVLVSTPATEGSSEEHGWHS